MKTLTALLTAGLLVLCLTVRIHAAQDKPKSPTVEELQKQITELQNEKAQLETALTQIADAYDDLQQAYEECMQGKDKDGAKPDKEQYTPVAPHDNTGPDGQTQANIKHLSGEIGAMKIKLADYKSGYAWLEDKVKSCKDGGQPSVCWGFWDKEAKHWKAMPCDGA